MHTLIHERVRARARAFAHLFVRRGKHPTWPSWMRWMLNCTPIATIRIMHGTSTCSAIRGSYRFVASGRGKSFSQRKSSLDVSRFIFEKMATLSGSWVERKASQLKEDGGRRREGYRSRTGSSSYVVFCLQLLGTTAMTVSALSPQSCSGNGPIGMPAARPGMLFSPSCRGDGLIGKPCAARPGLLRLRGGSEGGPGDQREFAEAGKTMRSPQHLVDEWIEQNFPLQNRKEWGHACLGLGACCVVTALTPLPLLNCFLSRKVLLAANIFLTAGCFLVSGPGSIRRFLFAPRRRLGTIILCAGFTLVWKQWTLIGLVVELVGFLGLFGPFLEGFPLICPPIPTTGAGLVRQLRNLYDTITAPIKAAMGSLDMERRDW